MAINFPDSPSLNQYHTVNGVTWKWDGTTWKGLPGSLNVASATVLGGIKVGTNLSIDANTGVLSLSGNGLSNIADSAQGVDVTGKVATTDGVDIDIGGSLNAAGTSIDFQNTTISFTGATIGGLNGSDVGLSNIADAGYGVDITGKAALTDGIDISVGGSINAAGTTVDFQNTTISFTGASIGGLQSTINSGVDVHLNQSTATSNEVLSWNGTDYEWVAQSTGTTLFTGLTDTPNTLTAGKILKVNSGGTALEYVDAPPSFTRTTVSKTTSVLASETSENIDFNYAAKSYGLYSITTNDAAWVTLYTSKAARTADANRVMTMDPVPGSGVIAEIITGGNFTQWVSPMLLGYNNEATPVNEIYAKVQNKRQTAVAITVTLKIIPLET